MSDEPITAPGRPAIRAVQTRLMVEFVAEGSGDELARFVAAVRPATLERARHSFALSWFPMDEHMHLCAGVHGVIGSDRFRGLMRDTFHRALETPMLRGVFAMMRRVADDPMTTLLRNAARLYGHVTRDVGSLEYVRAQGGQDTDARLEMTGWPERHFDIDVWTTGVVGCIEGAILGMHASATVTQERLDAAAGAASFRVRW